jgi:hypothetical protein
LVGAAVGILQAALKRRMSARGKNSFFIGFLLFSQEGNDPGGLFGYAAVRWIF